MVRWNTFAWLNLRHVSPLDSALEESGDEIDNRLEKM